jgi:dTDP-4-dehydrorhamnose 3,5-epimerase-like enzyme
MTINHVLQFDYPKVTDENGQLSIFQTGNGIPYAIKRVFTVLANAGDIRGDHSHISCSQILVCLAGEIKVKCDDGIGGEKIFNLKPNTPAVLIPPGIWAAEEYLIDRSVLLVICDKDYDPADYIRNYDAFTEQAKANQ